MAGSRKCRRHSDSPSPTKGQLVYLYARCILRNRLVLAAYCSLAIAYLLLWNYYRTAHLLPNALAVLLGSAATITLLLCGFGHDTVAVYLRTKRMLEKYGYLKKGFVDSTSRWYCTRVGLAMAAGDLQPYDKEIRDG